MKIILISGERGTGKTTILKRVAKELGYDYYTDFDILDRVEINHDCVDGDNGNIILLNLYRKFFNEHKNKNIVVDAELTILPEQLRLLQKEFDIDAIFLGFDGISKEDSIKQLNTKNSNMNLDELKNRAWGLLNLGENLKQMCEKENVRFQAININREFVIENLSNEIINKYKNLV